jgi:hypothetical protein
MSTINSTYEVSVGNTGSDTLSRVSAFFTSLFADVVRVDGDDQAADDAGVIYGAFGL